MRLSTSYGHHRFLRNFPDMFDFGLRLAEALDARLFEEVGGRNVTAASIDALLESDGPYVRLQVDTWRHTLDTLATSAHAALEYPLGAVDLVSDYYLFHVAPHRHLAPDAAAGVVAAALPNARVEPNGARGLGIAGDDGKRLAMALLQTDGLWAVRPAYGWAPFHRMAAATLAALDAIAYATHGAITFLGRSPDAATMAKIRGELSTGLGLDVFLWLQGDR